ncbi:MAG: glucans biosynthesis glucosyltransferase MdoH [Pseudomonadota bacterium]|nr:glucans biosynthesis glucosyltransferase MdoH [Pseudomonadota bacterium]
MDGLGNMPAGARSGHSSNVSERAAELSLMPPEDGLAMVEQDFARPHERVRKSVGFGLWSDGTVPARLFVLLATCALTGYGVMEMSEVVGAEATMTQIVFLVLFAISFGWIALAASNALLGSAIILLTSRPHEIRPTAPSTARTALVMPIYNEDTHQVFAALGRMAEEIFVTSPRPNFEIFVISDTTSAQIAFNEQVAAGRLRQALAGRMEVFYRRRDENIGRKAGNVAEFVRRWGARYDYMIVLDADSYMSADAVVELVRAMDADPDAGLIQTVPRLVNRNTLFARLLQFATAIYGPIIAAGLAAWHGRDGNFWGHNAIIRVRAFADSCGLPELKGRKPFGGPILSHDFVEAALLRRAGWDVYMLPHILGSYEEAPPTLADFAKRDRRWAQGNLQHIKVLPASGLHWMSRLHLLNGIMSYLASVFWMLFLVIGFALAVQGMFVRPDYFPDAHALFPHWPVFDSERAFWLMGFAMVVLLAPKLLALIVAALHTRARRGAGGILAMSLSVLLETLISALLAPVMMLLQIGAIAEILMARDSGWQSQRRNDGASSWWPIFLHHLPHTVFGAAVAAMSAAISIELSLWMLPVWLGLMLAIPLAQITSSRTAGIVARQLRLFLIPEERPERHTDARPVQWTPTVPTPAE